MSDVSNRLLQTCTHQHVHTPAGASARRQRSHVNERTPHALTFGGHGPLTSKHAFVPTSDFIPHLCMRAAPQQTGGVWGCCSAAVRLSSAEAVCSAPGLNAVSRGNERSVLSARNAAGAALPGDASLPLLLISAPHCLYTSDVPRLVTHLLYCCSFVSPLTRAHLSPCVQLVRFFPRPLRTRLCCPVQSTRQRLCTSTLDDLSSRRSSELLLAKR